MNVKECGPLSIEFAVTEFRWGLPAKILLDPLRSRGLLRNYTDMRYPHAVAGFDLRNRDPWRKAFLMFDEHKL